MATVNFPQPTTVSGPATSSDPATLSTAAAPTTSYVATDDVICLGWDYVVIGFVYTNGDETSIQVQPQGYDGATWRDLTFKAQQSSAVSEITADVCQLTKATYSTRYGAGVAGTGAFPPCNVRGFQKFRVQRKSTGGTPTGTIGFTATAGIEAAGSRRL